MGGTRGKSEGKERCVRGPRLGLGDGRERSPEGVHVLLRSLRPPDTPAAVSGAAHNVSNCVPGGCLRALSRVVTTAASSCSAPKTFVASLTPPSPVCGYDGPGGRTGGIGRADGRSTSALCLGTPLRSAAGGGGALPSHARVPARLDDRSVGFALREEPQGERGDHLEVRERPALALLRGVDGGSRGGAEALPGVRGHDAGGRRRGSAEGSAGRRRGLRVLDSDALAEVLEMGARVEARAEPRGGERRRDDRRGGALACRRARGAGGGRAEAGRQGTVTVGEEH